ncbi:hypothetical protein EYR40_001075 [Pleurotus pulmonarius]|nr:hypothetical protein EYR38_004318 [Pleurotus pulmonarius]KAF4608728.1 hypothetical protein EYR40_001075 [Pleurotus pulmonarius]
MASFPLARFTVAAAGCESRLSHTIAHSSILHTIATFSVMGFGYILMRATVPTEEQLYNVGSLHASRTLFYLETCSWFACITDCLGFKLTASQYALGSQLTTFIPFGFDQEMAPDIRRKVDASRAARLAREQAAAREADVQLSNPDPDAAKPIWANDRNK